MYHDPKTVLSPKERIKSVEVVFDKGPVDFSWPPCFPLKSHGLPRAGSRSRSLGVKMPEDHLETIGRDC